MSLEIKRLEVQLANIKAARLSNELRIDELSESIDRLKKDIDISLAKESELDKQIKDKSEGK